MGGQGSGRPTSAASIIKREAPQVPIGDGIYLPNYSGVQNSVLKTSTGWKKYVDDSIAAIPATTPGGSDKQVQFNDGGSFGGDSSFVWDKTNNRIGIGVAAPEKQLHIYSAEDCILIGATTKFPTLSFGMEIIKNDGCFTLTCAPPTSALSGRAFSVNLTTAGYPYATVMYYGSGTVGMGPGNSARDMFYGRSTTNTMKIASAYNLTGTGHLNVTGKIYSGTATISASSDTTNVSGINTLFIDITGDIVLGGLTGGVNGQSLNIIMLGNFINHVRLEHAEGVSSQDFINHTGVDEDISHGGCIYVCNGTAWYDASHARHV